MKNGEFSSEYQPEGELWTDKKRTALFGLPISTTQYALTNTKLIIRRGLITLREDEVQLYRVRDLALRQSLFERMSGTGTIHICSTDAMTPEIEIQHVKNPRTVKELLSKTVESCRKASGIRTSEIVGGQGEPLMPHPHMMP